MTRTTTIKSMHKSITEYYKSRQTFARHHVAHESAVRSAFQQLLSSSASLHHWTLIPELRMKVAGKTVIPDGTLKDLYNIPRGFWESKDESDNLDATLGQTLEEHVRYWCSTYGHSMNFVLQSLIRFDNV